MTKDATNPQNMRKEKRSKLPIYGIVLSLLVSYYVYYNCLDYQYPNQEINVNITGSTLSFTRTEHLTLLARGANSMNDLYKALGWMHAKDRYVQMCLFRLAAKGKITETFPYSELNYKFDMMSKQFRFASISKENMEKHTRHESELYKVLVGYVDGINNYMATHNRPYEFMLLNYYPEPFTPSDVTTILRFISYVGLNEICISTEKLVIETLVSGKTSKAFLKEVFSPHLENLTDYHVNLYRSVKDLKSNDGYKSPFLPPIINSNNWVVSGKKSVSGMPIMGSDPHLDVIKQPNMFYESQYESIDGSLKVFSVSVPGLPIVLMGRTQSLAFSFTYGMMDMGDYFVENIKNKTYQRGDAYIPLIKHTHTVAGKAVTFYETEEGHYVERSLSQADKDLEDGRYFAVRLAEPNAQEAACFKLAAMPFKKTVKDVQPLLPQSILGMNYLLADTEGNIGYQQSGFVPLRDTSHGLLPLPAWETENLWKGFLSDDDYLRDVNPDVGFYATSNNKIQAPDKPIVNTYPATIIIRANRAKYLLKAKEKHSVQDMMDYQSDTFSTIANITIPLMEEFLPKSGIANELRSWDRVFRKDCKASALWFDIWALFVEKISIKLLGYDEVQRIKPFVLNKFIMSTFAVHGIMHHNIDGEDVRYFLKDALMEGVAKYDGGVYGDRRVYYSKNMLFDGKLPAFLGFDTGPHPTNSGFETLKVGFQEKYLDGDCVFSQTWRFVCDLSEDIFYSVLPGGPSGNYFSNIYLREVDLYLKDQYKKGKL